MKKRIIAALACASAAAMGAESPRIEHVLVTVPLHKKSSETALPVTVLSGEDLRRAASSTLGDTLAIQPGLNNASFGPGVGQPVIRGQQGARVTVLQNGTISADASNLSADHAVAVESILADSIEVLRGPATLLYGGGAIGGVVNVTDGRIPSRLVAETETAAELRYNAVNDEKTGVVRIDASSGDLALHLDAVVRRWGDLTVPKNTAEPLEHHDEHAEEHAGEEVHAEEAYEGPPSRLANTDGETDIVTLGLSRHFNSGFVGFSVQRQEGNYGIPAAAHAHHDHEEELGADPAAVPADEMENPEQGIRIDLEQTRYDLAAHLHEPLPILDELRLFTAYTDYQHAEIEPSGEVGTTYSNDSTQVRLEAVHKTVGILHGVFGVQIGQSEFSALGEEAFIPVTDKNQLGLFLVEDLHFDAGLLELGARYDRDELDPESGANTRTFNNLSFSASWVQSLDDGWQWSVAYSHAERAPAIEELFSNAGILAEEDWVVHAATEAIELGAPNLDSETSDNVDFSVSRSWGGHFVEAVLYHNQFSDYIGLLNAGLEVDAVSVYRYEQTDAVFSGLELTSVWALGEFASGDMALTFNGDVSRGKLDSGLGFVPRMPANRLFAQLDWRGDELYVWARTIHAFEQDRVAVNEEPTQSYTKLDAGLEWVPSQASDWTLFASLRNITDEEIRLHTSFLKDIAPEQGRGFEIGIRGQF